MICSVLLLIILTSCVSGTFVVNVTQTSYQAEENHDITLEWTFTTNPHSSSNSLYILCELITDLRPSILFRLNKGVEVPESQDEQFAGRVQWDKDVLREGQLRLHVSRLRTEDSGMYVCDVILNYKSNSGRCRLNVTAVRDRPEPEPPNTTSPPQPESRGWIGLCCGLGLTAAALLGFCVCRLLREEHFPSKFKGGLRKSYSSACGSVETVSSTTSKRLLEFDFIRQRHRNSESVC